MNFLRTTHFKKTSAILLLSLFVFVHAAKAFHTHDFSFIVAKDLSNKNAANIKANFFCAICDFQIAKDSDAETATLNISAPLFFIHSYYNYTSATPCFFSIVSSVRGPPVFFH